MGVADMSFKPPIEVLSTLENEIKRGFLGYYGGIESYRREVTKWLKTKHDWEPKPEWVSTAHGLVAAIGTALRAFTNQSDGIIIFSPVYHQFRNIIKANNREMIESEMIKKNGRYYLDLDNLENKVFSGMSLYYCGIIGLVITGLLIWVTEYYTGTNYRPVRSVASSSTTGHGTNVIQGLAVSLEATAIPALIIVTGILATNHIAGLYGIAIAVTTMLALAGMVVAPVSYTHLTLPTKRIV